MIGGHGRTANPDAAPARPGPRAASQDRPRGERRNRPAQRGRVPVRRRRGAQLRAPERRRSRRRAAPRRTDLVVPLPQGAPRNRRPGPARHGLRLSGSRAGRSPRGLRLFLVGLGGNGPGEAIDALGLDRIHLVVHDVGGPIGFEWAIRNPGRVLSLTVLNTFVDAGSFRRPWPMHPFSIKGIGEVWLRASPRLLFSEIFYSLGIAERALVPRSDIYAHVALVRLRDRGRAFLKIMRGFELTEEKERFFRAGLSAARLSGAPRLGRARPGLRPRASRELPQGAGGRGRDHAAGQALPAGGPARPRSAQAIADLAAPLG